MPSRTRADLAADFDVVLARIPDRLFLWGPLVLTGLGLVLLALSAPWLALLVGLALPWGVAYARVGYRRDVASALATSAPAIEPAWQARYAQIEQTAGLLAARNGQAAPRLLVDPAPASINAVAIRGEGQDFLSLGAGLLDAGLSSVLAFDDLVAASAHEIAHLRPAMRDEPRRGALLSTLLILLTAAAWTGALVPALGPANANLLLLELLLPVGWWFAKPLLTRREELEADRIAARLLGEQGPAQLVYALARVGFAVSLRLFLVTKQPAYAHRLLAVARETVRLGALGFDPAFEPAIQGAVERPNRRYSLGQRILFRLADGPIADHPSLLGVARMLEVPVDGARVRHRA
jgi:Zn-dependent protease with chaperone function